MGAGVERRPARRGRRAPLGAHPLRVHAAGLRELGARGARAEPGSGRAQVPHRDLRADSSAPTYSVLPVAWSSFFEGAVALGKRAATLDLDQLKSGLALLSTPGPGDVLQAQQLCEKALAHPLVGEVQRRLFGGSDAMHYYAYQTFLTACQDAAKNDPGKAATVLDCPIHVDVDLFVWLELARRVFGFPPAHPSYFWTEDPSPRLLFSLGPAPLLVLQFLANPPSSTSASGRSPRAARRRSTARARASRRPSPA
ncbi:MAG: hypothetical protein M5U28_28940 [Sandaracinaceae bacterium]|nr:hypothetical protein [Sandaracinaceae bacterium]